MKKFNTCIVLALLLVLTACSSLRLAYNNGGMLMYWWMDAYVDFDSEQKADVKQDIADFFQWHRKTQLRDYVQVLQHAQQELKGEVTTDELIASYNDIRDRTEALLLRSAPDIADLALTLKPEQLVAMEKKFTKNNADFRKKNMKGDREEQNKFRYKKSMEQFELWFGDFSSAQERQIRQASDARPLDNQFWLDERIRRQFKILALARKIMEEKPSREVAIGWIETMIRDSFDRYEQGSRKVFFDNYTRSTAEFVHTVIALATPEQKAHAHKRMQGWIEDFNSLSAQAK